MFFGLIYTMAATFGEREQKRENEIWLLKIVAATRVQESITRGNSEECLLNSSTALSFEVIALQGLMKVSK